jgi:gliding motility-associated-like protein
LIINPSFSFSNSGIIDSIYTLRLIATSSHGCKDTIIKNITVYPNPKSKFTPTDSMSCAPFTITNSIINLTQYINTNDTYNWYKNGVYYATGTNFPSYTMTNDGDTVYFTLITSNIHGCKQDTMTKRFITIIAPVANFTPISSTGCHPYTVAFVNQSTPIGINSQWIFGNGQTSVSASPVATFINSSNTIDTVYNVKLIITAALTGCKDTIIHTVTVYPKPKSDFAFVNQSACASAIVNTTNTSLSKGTPTYSWSVLNNSSVLISNPASTTPNFTFPDFQTGSDSIYQIRLIVTSGDGCKDTIIKNITIHTRPKANFTIASEACGPWNTSVINTSQNASSYIWSVNPPDVNISNTTASSPIFTFPANYTSSPLSYSVFLTTLSVNSCIDTLTKFVNINPTSLANFYFVQNAQPYPNHWRVDFFNTSINSTIWSWNFGDGSSSTLFQPTHSYSTIGVYHITLHANNQYNCPSDTTIAIILKEQWRLYVASAFAPDDINPQVAIFKAIGKNLAEFNMQIFDTWGKLLYETNELINTQPAEGWNGNYNGKPMPMDVYVWKIYAKFIDGSIWRGMEQDGEVKPYGSVTLIR